MRFENTMRSAFIVTLFFYIVIAGRVNKRQIEGDIWIWGYENGTKTSNLPHDRIQANTKAAVTEKTTFNPCLILDPETPDFRPPGTRTSEAKFHEYMWELHLHKFLSKRTTDCERYKGNFKKFPFVAIPTVYGGRKALFGEFPHMGALGWETVDGKWSFKCGSTLISRSFVLTAAHCSKVPSRDTTVADVTPKIVRFVDIHSVNFAVDRNISSIIVHPKYKPPVQTYDIALIKLENDVNFLDTIHPAGLWSNSDISSLGTKGIVTGWGVTTSGPVPVNIRQTLQVGEVDIIDWETCDGLLRPMCNRNQCGVQDHQICAGLLAGGVDTCQGDSGGPLQVRIPNGTLNIEYMYYVMGVTSYGFGCALENSPGVYTRVSSFIDWIEDTVWPGE